MRELRDYVSKLAVRLREAEKPIGLRKWPEATLWGQACTDPESLFSSTCLIVTMTLAVDHEYANDFYIIL